MLVQQHPQHLCQACSHQLSLGQSQLTEAKTSYVDICKYNEAELTAFSEATIATIRGCACPGPNPENTNSDEVQKSLLRVEANKEICCPVNCRNHLGR